MAGLDRQSLRAIALVAGVAIVAAAIMSGSYEISAERIRQNQRERLLEGLHEVLDPAVHDNDLLQDRIFVTNPDLLGTPDPVEVFLASRDGTPVAAVFAPVAPRGYNGPIRLLVGIYADGTVSGVRVTEHRETPGLADQIDIEKSDWITGFDGKSLSSPPVTGWSVVSEGGEFDAFTSATVTPRAIVRAVRDTLIYFQQNEAELFSRLSATDATAETLVPGATQ